MGVEGLEAEAGSGLQRWDPNRYGSLHIPGDGFSYDIFTQVSRALVSSRWRTGADPLAGLSVKHCIGTGQSQSAARLATYVNAVHPVTNLFSGFMFCVLVGSGSELSNPEIIPGETAAEYNRRFFSMIVPCVIHDDLDTPILILLSESEARNFGVPPQPDSKWVRVWEVAARWCMGRLLVASPVPARVSADPGGGRHAELAIRLSTLHPIFASVI